MLIGFAGGSASAIIVYLTLNFTNFLYTERSDLSFFITTGLVGMIWLPVCCVTSIAFRKSTEMNELINLKLSMDITNEIKQSNNLPVLVFTHPKDPYDGLLSDWVEEIPGVKRIVISEDKKINGKKCFRIGVNNGKEWKEKVKKYHDMDMVDCFQYYNSIILDYISSRVSS